MEPCHSLLMQSNASINTFPWSSKSTKITNVKFRTPWECNKATTWYWSSFSSSDKLSLNQQKKHGTEKLNQSSLLSAQNVMKNYYTEVNSSTQRNHAWWKGCIIIIIIFTIFIVETAFVFNSREAMVQALPKLQRHFAYFGFLTNFSSIQCKVVWMHYWTNSEVCTFAQCLIVFTVVKGIFFSGAFCAVFWLKKISLLSGLFFANVLISHDKDLHHDFAVYINYKCLFYSDASMIVHCIIAGAVEIETAFMN